MEKRKGDIITQERLIRIITQERLIRIIRNFKNAKKRSIVL
jgi:hypothetical protein